MVMVKYLTKSLGKWFLISTKEVLEDRRNAVFFRLVAGNAAMCTVLEHLYVVRSLRCTYCFQKTFLVRAHHEMTRDYKSSTNKDVSERCFL